MSALRLVIFDVDGTLVDSQADIVAAMSHAFARAGREAPTREAILSIVGLSLDRAMTVLAPDMDAAMHARMVEWYKEAYIALRAKIGAAESSPLYPGAREVLEALHAQPETLLGVATGKSRRGLDKLLEGHGLERMFITQQVSDHHPSKPHPSMIRAALSETGLEPHQAVMVGDTSFDMEMAAAAGVAGIGVGWGYHPREALGAARHVIERFDDLPPLLQEIWETAA
ncbi:HAD-IA family hydrolase [Roseovarius atlanticus]|uniref:HAD-IA family hydrolase n=1 Tax=Roseovarius atlanticus TaxID=1641875 RepID=UPI001C96DDC1|nr:HAD-IA family hydrolase [Roseovarius atlanticus]MBY5987423.1 HAD-IA family hydrolase [Roseovarius atlanticus]MBY6126063.1 HAD-IA family hydrolase [Roseovarius atlanticus]MBY6149477.1 HAD-IA family hydrolase [Roseovarius atlanticus]